ncbi:hypothetical protein [Clostridium sp. Cult3]|uniref:hypothetical protein n=1 Tax=Clostridium sp. Cult3 TaxID=2079004 RepID=UPI001F16F648|nr:hypothetical protein [Clostridium sp. Cult3]
MLILGQKYTIKRVGNERNIEKIEIDKTSYMSKYRALLGVFSIVLGTLCIINYIIY